MRTVNFNGEQMILLGTEINVGDKAPSCSVLTTALEKTSIEELEGKVKLVSVVPSIDTGVCSTQTNTFNKEVAALDHVQAVTISMDLPFAQERWQEENNANDVIMLSDHVHADFGMKYGVLIQKLRLLTRAVFIIDSSGVIVYEEIVEEVTDSVNYEAALEALKSAK
ncbi:MAG TPA: thiol peroxidase [Bacillota bacterium]|nr:thiol peroxidase [Bacillota bacterium]